MRMDKAHWLRCLLWHGWLPMLSGVNGASPWAADASGCIGLLVVWILGFVVFLMWNCSLLVTFGMERDCPWKRLLADFGQGVQFQCRLFCLVQALIFGALAVSLVL